MGTSQSTSSSSNTIDTNYKEGYVYGQQSNRCGESYDENFFATDTINVSKGARSIESLKRIEEEKKPTEVKMERFHGFSFKSNEIEPFERTHIDY